MEWKIIDKGFYAVMYVENVKADMAGIKSIIEHLEDDKYLVVSSDCKVICYSALEKKVVTL